MKKWVGVLVGTLVVVAVALPFYSGYKTQKTLDALVQTLNQQGYSLRWQSYDKGVWRTRAVLLAGFRLPVLGAESDWALPVQFDVRHGPILSDGGLGWFSSLAYLSPDQIPELIERVEAETEEHLLTSRMRMNLLGHITLTDRIQAFSIDLDDAVLEMGAYHGEGTLSRRSLFTYEGSLPVLRVLSEDSQMQLERMAMRMRSDFGRRQGVYVVPGEGSLRLAAASVVNDDEVLFRLQDLQANSHYDLNADAVTGNTRAAVTLASAEFLGEQLSDARLEMAVERLSSAFLNQYVELVMNVVESGQMGSPLLAMQLMHLVTTELLPHSPEIAVPVLRFQLAEGRLDFRARVRVKPLDDAAQANPFALISAIHTDADLRISKTLLVRFLTDNARKSLAAEQFESGVLIDSDTLESQASEQAALRIGLLQIQGFLQEDGDDYSVRFVFEDGSASVNNQPLPLPF